MTQAPASSAGRRVGRPSAHGRAPLALAPTLSERRREENRKNLGLVAKLRCECSIPGCGETFPADADIHRGAGDCFIIAPAHFNGRTPVRVADQFFVISNTERR